MMKLASYYSLITILNVMFMVSFLISCSLQKNKGNSNLLSISVEGSELIDHDGFNNRLSQMTNNLNKADNLYLILSELWSEPYSQYSVMSINKLKDHGLDDVYAATLIFDNIADDDSIMGYRYDVKFKKNLQGIWQITEVKRSWRCWQDRGHSYFSVEPCS